MSDMHFDKTILGGGNHNADEQFNPGDELGEYTIKQLLGKGAMGEVYLAEHGRLKRQEALKILPRELVLQQDFLDRFDQEAQALAGFDHPSIVRVYNAGTERGFYYIAMEYVEGGTLDDHLREKGGKLGVDATRTIIQQVLEALQYAHENQIVHRDIKPANVLLTKNGKVKVSDFGLAQVFGGEFVQTIVQQTNTTSQIDSTRTVVNTDQHASFSASEIAGTIDYMSPEVRNGQGADARSDLYAVGVMAYKLLTGDIPMGRCDSASTLVKGLSSKWDTWLDTLMSLSPDKRFQRAQEALDAMETLGRNKAQPRMRLWVVWVVVFVIGVCVVSFWNWESEEKSLVEDSKPAKVTRGNIENPADESNRILDLGEVSLELVYIQPGTFQMGSAQEERGRDSDEGKHTVNINEGYWLGETEVTQSQWNAVMGGNSPATKNMNHPVENVTWSEVMEFCAKVTQEERSENRLPTGYEYHLPTEAQWEYACRSGTRGTYAGNLDSMAWYGNNSEGKTHAVGKKQANAWGLYDMHGNVWEWCSDWYGRYPSGATTDPVGPISGSSRVYRGGGWLSFEKCCRAADRDDFSSSGRDSNLGFRLALRLKNLN